MPPASLLDVRDVHVAYGAGVRALQGVSLHVQPGEVVALIGANGAGKTTLLKAIAGLVEPQAGEVSFDGQAIERGGRARPRQARALRSCPRAAACSAG